MDKFIPYLHGAEQLLAESRDAVRARLERLAQCEDPREKSKLAEEALYEMKVRAAIEDLILHPAGRRLDLLEKFPWPVLILFGSLLLAAAAARAQNNQGGEQLNPATSANTIANGGSTGAAMPVNKVIVPVTDAGGSPVPAAKPPAKKISDRILARRIRREIAGLGLAPGSRNVKAAAASGKITLTGTVLSEDDKNKIAAKAAEVAGADNVVNRIDVKPAIPIETP